MLTGVVAGGALSPAGLQFEVIFRSRRVLHFYMHKNMQRHTITPVQSYQRVQIIVHALRCVIRECRSLIKMSHSRVSIRCLGHGPAGVLNQQRLFTSYTAVALIRILKFASVYFISHKQAQRTKHHLALAKTGFFLNLIWDLQSSRWSKWTQWVAKPRDQNKRSFSEAQIEQLCVCTGLLITYPLHI